MTGRVPGNEVIGDNVLTEEKKRVLQCIRSRLGSPVSGSSSGQDFHRPLITAGDALAPDKATATLRDGLFRIELPKV